MTSVAYAKVVNIVGNYIYVSCEQKEACGQCSRKESCGGNKLGSIFTTKKIHEFRFQVNDISSYRVGDTIKLEISDGLLIFFTLLLYILPLFLGVISVLFLSRIVQSELLLFLSFLFFIIVSLFIIKFILNRNSFKTVHISNTIQNNI